MDKIKIQGVEITPLKIIEDNRGDVLHMLRNDSIGFENFGECYFSEIKPGIIKAWKRHQHQSQNLTVPIGSIELVIYDNRPESLTKGNLLKIIIGRPNNYFRVKIPAKVWYGFKSNSNLTSLIVNCTNIPHDPDDNELINIQDFLIPF